MSLVFLGGVRRRRGFLRVTPRPAVSFIGAAVLHGGRDGFRGMAPPVARVAHKMTPPLPEYTLVCVSHGPGPCWRESAGRAGHQGDSRTQLCTSARA